MRYLATSSISKSTPMFGIVCSQTKRTTFFYTRLDHVFGGAVSIYFSHRPNELISIPMELLE